MLVQDWLQASNFPLTLRCFLDECKQLGKELPSSDKWYSMTEQLQLDQFNRPSGLTSRNATKDSKMKNSISRPAVESPPSLLETVVQFTITKKQRDVERHRQQQQQQQQQQQPTVLMSKRLMQVKELKLLGKCGGLSSAASAPVLQQLSNTSSGKHSGGGLRPKSAAVCSSTPELIARSLLGNQGFASATQTPDRVPSISETRAQTKERPISASGMLTPSRDSNSRAGFSTEPPGLQSSSPHQRKSLKANNAAADSTASQCHASRASISELPLIVEDRLAKEAAQMDSLDEDSDDGEPLSGLESPALDLEDMSEERLVAQFSSLDKTAIKRLRRVLAKSSACTQEFERSKRTLDKIQTKAKLRQSRRAMAAEQTLLLSNSMDVLNKEPCSLCQYIFLKKNLVMRVSYKSILDLRRFWAKKKELDERAQAHTMSLSASGDQARDCEHLNRAVHKNGNGGEIGGHDESSLDRAQQAHLYDEVPLCAFCSQLVLHSSSYRPSSAAQRATASDEKRQAIEQQKQKEAAHVHDQNRCDPLNFDSYRLNSDDDDSDVDELLEFDAEGRPHVTKRRRQKTGRIPAQLGLVSKRLHYDQLRSRTLPSLNNKEWQVLNT
ncbi:hypothetical protein Gpo141_00007876 [Globisporangium polare]